MAQQKIRWKPFFRDSSLLISYTLLFGFFLKVALVLFQYYKAVVPACIALALSFCFALPLLLDFFDLWARLVSYVGEPLLSEKMFKISLALCQRIFGKKNLLYARKQAMLASIYFDSGRTAEADELYKEAYEVFATSPLKLVFMPTAFADYAKLLDTAYDTESRKESVSDLAGLIRKNLRRAALLSFAQHFAVACFTAPIVIFLWQNQLLEASIARHNSHGQTGIALREVALLAERESSLLGPYAAARVYRDYANAFGTMDDPQLKETAWCAERGLQALKRSNVEDDYLKVLLLNLKARMLMARGTLTEAEIAYEEAVSIASSWDASKLATHNNDAQLQRDEAFVGLAEILRNQGNYQKAEPLYQAVLGYENSKKSPSANFDVVDPVSTLDRIHKLQHIQTKLGKKERNIELQKLACGLLEDRVEKLLANNQVSPVCDFGVREAARELDVCALMLAESGDKAAAENYRQRAEKLRAQQRKKLDLDSGQQESIVEASTRLTEDLLSVKYKAGDWQKSLRSLLENDLTTSSARGAFERLPWFDPDYLKSGSKALSRSGRRLEVDIFPMSVRSNRGGEGIAIDVQGTVKIMNEGSKDAAEEQRFAFAYVMQGERGQKGNRPQLLDLLDNQGAYGRLRLD